MLWGLNASMKGFIMLFKCMKELDMKTTSAIIKKEVWLLVTMPLGSHSRNLQEKKNITIYKNEKKIDMEGI